MLRQGVANDWLAGERSCFLEDMSARTIPERGHYAEQH